MDDGTVITLRRHGNPAGPRMVLSNGNGLAADLYYPFWSLLADQFDIVVHDLRSHGWNAVSSLRTHNIPTLIRDNWNVSATIEAHFGAKPKAGVFHSLATLPALFHGPDDAGFAALVLFDPPICPPGGSPSDLEALLQPSAARARRRKRFFETREEFTEAISRSQVFARIPADTLDLFAQTTLRPAANGGYELCCPPEHEAQIFEFYFGWAIQVPDVLKHVECPVIAIGSDPTSSHSYMPSMNLRTLNTLRYDLVPDTTHFLQLEDPETCAALTLDFLEEQGVA